MKRWKTWQICLFVLLCLLLNCGGRLLAEKFELPFWLDSFGTVLCAYFGGPVTGAVVGMTGNLLYGVMNRFSHIYAIAGIAIGFIIGMAAKKRYLRNILGIMTASTIAAVACVVICVPLNFFYNGGSTGNIWGDGVMNYLREQGLPLLICASAGEFYLEIVDKFITLLFLYLLLCIVSFFARRQRRKRIREEEDLNGGAAEAKTEVSSRPKPPGSRLLGLMLLFLASLCTKVSAAEEAEVNVIDYSEFVQTVYSSDNGLPCGEANDIAETKDGILWIGTYAGLYRFNGSEFRWMDGYDSVKNVNCLYVDPEGRLWIGTNDNGLSIAINEKIVNVVDQSGGLPSNSVRCIIQSSDGYYYVGTTGSMQILTLNSGLKKVNTIREVNYADVITADENGHVAAVTSDGRLFLMKGGEVLCSRQITGGEELFNSCSFAPDGRLLAGSSTDHIYIYDITGEKFTEEGMLTCAGMSNINEMYHLENGDTLVTADNGIGYLDKERNFHAVNSNSFNNSIDNMLVDYQGNLWFTSSRLGLLRLSQSAFKDVYSTIGMTGHVVNTVAGWQNAYYFGTDKGLDIVDASCRNEIKNSLTEEFKDVRIRCIYADTNEHLWICTYGEGLVEVEPDGTEYYYNSENGSFGNRARLVTELADGTIVAAGDTGMSFIKDHVIEQNIGFADGLINSMILTVTELDDGRILAGTDGDGIAVLEDRQVVRMITRDDGLSSEVILRTVKDSKTGGVFIVTSNGLCYMDAEGAVRALEHFPYYNNYDVWIKENDKVFVMGSSGIHVVSRAELLADVPGMHYDLLDSRKGLNSALTANSWNYEDGHGNLFLSCDRGVFIIDTERYSSDSRSYRMSISSVNLDNTPYRVEKGSPILAGRGVSRVEIHPEIINYTIQDPFVGYYLEEFEEQWTILPQSSLGSIVYTNLPSGSYTLHLAVFDSNQEQILEERTFSVVKEKEIYDNRWFKFYMLLVGALAIVLFTWLIVGTRVQATLNMQKRELALANQQIAIANQQIQMGNETVIAIAKAVDAKDVRTSEHSQRVAKYSVLIGKELGFSDKECENLYRAASMHDIGKIGIPDNILNKPARLTDEEYGIMKSHVVRGGEILKDFTLIENVVQGALYHHERYDGRGYPEGLKGEEIPLYGRIIGVADAFDAMTANRVYRKQMDFDYVLGEMKKNRGTQFDPQMVDILLRLIDEGKIDLKKLYPPMEEESKGGDSV